MNIHSIRALLALAVGSTLPMVAWAHPDHPHTLGFADSWGHLFSSPDHLLMLLIPAIAAIWIGKWLLRWQRERSS
jgi:hydrogenase/urease accessory protein HupE